MKITEDKIKHKIPLQQLEDEIALDINAVMEDRQHMNDDLECRIFRLYKMYRDQGITGGNQRERI